MNFFDPVNMSWFSDLEDYRMEGIFSFLHFYHIQVQFFTVHTNVHVKESSAQGIISIEKKN